MDGLSAIWNLFFSVFEWIFFPSTQNPIVFCVGVFIVSSIALYFLGKILGLRGYRNV